jgi:hypothetical protein
MVLEDSTEVGRGNTYGQVERIGGVRKQMDVPLYSPPPVHMYIPQLSSPLFPRVNVSSCKGNPNSLSGQLSLKI